MGPSICCYKLLNIGICRLIRKNLIPKGPLVPTRDKPVLGCVV
jgi:hypothetical protein